MVGESRRLDENEIKIFLNAQSDTILSEKAFLLSICSLKYAKRARARESVWHIVRDIYTHDEVKCIDVDLQNVTSNPTRNLYK